MHSTSQTASAWTPAAKVCWNWWIQQHFEASTCVLLLFIFSIHTCQALLHPWHQTWQIHRALQPKHAPLEKLEKQKMLRLKGWSFRGTSRLFIDNPSRPKSPARESSVANVIFAFESSWKNLPLTRLVLLQSSQCLRLKTTFFCHIFWYSTACMLSSPARKIDEAKSRMGTLAMYSKKTGSYFTNMKGGSCVQHCTSSRPSQISVRNPHLGIR